MKFDWLLYLLDRSLGLSAFAAARLFADWQRPLLALIYQSLVYFMILCYVLNLNRGDGRPGKLLVAYLVSFVVGPCLYLVAPACGPRYAFGNTFPGGSPDVSPVLIKLSAWPNAIPSLHLSTALLFVLFAGRSRALRLVACIYLLGTIAATLAFEHYVIDLIVAVPFGCFAALTAERKISKALANLGLVLAWLLAIRFATPALLLYPPVLRILAFATVAFAAFSMAERQTSMSGALPQPATDLPCATLLLNARAKRSIY